MIKDEFYTAMCGNKYVYVAGYHGLSTARTPRKTMTFRGKGAYEKVKKKLEKTECSSYYNKHEIKIVKVTVEEV